jgi:hypothetical protein
MLQLAFASLALARTRSQKACAALVKLTKTASWKDLIKTAGLNSLTKLGDARSLSVLK